MEQRKKLIELINNADKLRGSVYIAQLAVYLLDNGVVVPVLCGECTHGEDDGTGIQCHKHNKQFGDYDFCSYGERRGNNK